jgi:type 1 fimbria pilin
MRGQRLLVLAACSVAMMFASSVVKAGGGGTIDGGIIRFVGAVVEPTCSAVVVPEDVNQAVAAGRTHQSLQRSCSAPTTAGVATVTDNSRPYDVNVVHLSSSESDHVLNYFANYVRAAQPGTADPVLLTQTYE